MLFETDFHFFFLQANALYLNFLLLSLHLSLLLCSLPFPLFILVFFLPHFFFLLIPFSSSPATPSFSSPFPSCLPLYILCIFFFPLRFSLLFSLPVTLFLLPLLLCLPFLYIFLLSGFPSFSFSSPSFFPLLLSCFPLPLLLDLLHPLLLFLYIFLLPHLHNLPLASHPFPFPFPFPLPPSSFPQE